MIVKVNYAIPVRWAFVFIYLFLCYGTSSLHAQSTYGGLFPEAALTLQFTENFFAKVKIESQHGLFGETPRRAEGENYFHYRTDLQGFVGSQIGMNATIAIGYQYRFDPEGAHHRIIQQITFKNSGRKWQHRIRTDQTFENQSPTEWRVRYRIRYKKNFTNGSLYIMLSDEMLYAYHQAMMSWENRLVASLGKNINDNSRVEIGPDYRLDADFGGLLRTRWWLKLGWYMAI